VAGALHDVSNALTVILGWVAHARAEGASGESIAHALMIVEQQAKMARDLARRAIGAAPLAMDLDDALDSLLEGIVDALAVEAARAGVVLRRTGRSAGLRVPMPTDVLQIVTNLVLNALAHAPRGSEVRLGAATTSSAIIVEVLDEGPGVAAGRRETIFEGDSARMGGAGVGLRHARSMARDAGGDLELADVPRGACFRLTWPRASVLSVPPPSVPSVPVLLGTRVLVVEDDENVTLLLETALSARGAVVTVARDASELQRAFLAGPHDAVLIDLSPIASDVQGAIDALRERSPEAAIVFISGSAAGLPEPLNDDSISWVRKPFEVGELVTAVLAARKKARSP
jgi:CheY-like chemotaxis protein